MPTLSVCRVCLARDIRMLTIANTPLQTTFEKLSGTKLITEDIKPELICFICFAQLQRCCKFMEMSIKAEKILSQILHNGIGFAERITMLDGEIPYKLSMSTTKHASLPEYIKNENPDVFIKEEIIELGEKMSVQVQTKGDPVAEIPVEYDVRAETNSLKRELNSSEFDGDSLNSSCLTAYYEEHNSKAKNKETLLIIQSSNTEKLYACDICSTLFKQNAEENKTKCVKPFICLRCHDTSYKHDFRKHITVNSKEKLYTCDTCAKAFFSKYSLKVHITHKHMGTHTWKKAHNCDRCNKTFNHRGTLRIHMRTHTGDKPYACDKCSKTFSQKGTLQRHIRMHTGEKPYACDKCTKTFNQESSLKRHIKMHTGEKPYTCNACDKAYYESSHLTRHMRTHTGEKPYACDRCFQTFGQSSNLQAHMKKHTGETASKYICYECNKAFDHKSIFKRHILKHTREKPYPCDRCDKKYADKRTLQRHIATHT